MQIDHLDLYVVYFNPKDFPDKFVARKFIIDYSGRQTPGHIIATANTIEEVRAKIPEGLYRQIRSENDDPCIVETWL